MSRRIIGCLVVCAVVLATSALQAGEPEGDAVTEPVEVNDEIKGSYTHPHGASIYDPEKDEWTPTEVSDCLWVAPKGDALTFDLLVIATNAHLCSISGDAKRQGDGWVFRDKGEGGEVCEIHIRLTDTELQLSEQNNSCKAYYCGARASIGELRFARKRRDAKGERCNVD